MATTGKTCNSLLILLSTLGLLLSSCAATYQIVSGQIIYTGGYLIYGTYRFIMQSDCNLVLYDGDNSVWTTGTNGLGDGCQCWMQNDGNLVVYSGGNQAMWASNTIRGTGIYVLILQPDRDVVIYDPSFIAIWDTGTTVVAAAANVTQSTISSNNATVPPAKKTTVRRDPTNVEVTTGKKKTSNGGNP